MSNEKIKVVSSDLIKEEEIKIKINYTEIYDLVGKLLTFVDATFQDKEQRKAMKTLIKHTVYDWYELIESEQHPKFHSKNKILMKGLGNKTIPEEVTKI